MMDKICWVAVAKKWKIIQGEIKGHKASVWHAL